MGHRVGITMLAAAASITAAQAKEVRYPAAKPEVSLNVPEDWSVTETALGLELQSPQKDALVLAGLTAADRKSVDGWSKRALERMGSEGVVFAKAGTAKTESAKTGPAKSEPAKTAAPPAGDPGTPKVSGQPAKSLTADVAKRNGDLPYTFGGAPLVDPLKDANAKAPTAGALAADMPSVTTIPADGDPSALKPSGDFVYAGGTMRGQPVDVELAVYPLGKHRRVLIEQQSGPTDIRGVMITRSLRDLTR